MQGLKTRNDPEAYWHTAEGRALEAYYNKVNRIAEKNGCVFFFDTVDCGDDRTLWVDGELFTDLRGWLIPFSKAEEFKTDWDKENVGEQWVDFIRWAEWSANKDGLISIEIKDYPAIE